LNAILPHHAGDKPGRAHRVIMRVESRRYHSNKYARIQRAVTGFFLILIMFP